MAFSLTSRVFESGAGIPVRYTAEGEGVSPPLEWSGVPQGTREFALICEDPDAPFPRPFVHWILYGLSANTTQLPEGIPPLGEIEFPILARQGLNSMRGLGFTGPNPPLWHRAHHYHFRLYALDAPIPLHSGIGRTAFFREIEGHVLAEATLTGLYQRQGSVQLRRDLELIEKFARYAFLAYFFFKAKPVSKEQDRDRFGA